ncbi:MAG: hypothetical protein EU547_01880 [Promethearchaeota archaeon]|nr:MAG: hypothetical protein EU547_01880 [Candidatus Lokiarchaeota archaeon]
MIAETVLIIIFFIVLIIGAYIIYRQVALVKKEELIWMDYAKCLFYGIIFSSAVMIVIVMAFIFAINSPDLWEYSTIKPQSTINPIVLFIPMIICLFYITIYPLIDFIYLAISSGSKKGLTIFHKVLGEKIINRFDSKLISILISIGFYLTIFIIPPLLLTLLGIPLILIWSTWLLVYPLMILTYYGSKGYIAGITNAYVHLPDPSRSLFLPFEDTEKTLKEFIDDPFSRIIIGLMLFVFVWQWISAFQTLFLIISGSMAISPYSYSGMVFITLLFGVIGYFTRFWGRKIQYRAIDVYFAAYLMAGVGINVFVNFLIVNISKLTGTLNTWTLTAPISETFLYFAFPAVIEEITLILFTSYYFLVRSSTFNINFFESKIAECGQTFDPIPLFNFIKSDKSDLRNQAEKNLVNMYERIPLKAEIDLNKVKYKHPLIDGLSDPNPNARKISYKILTQLAQNAPNMVYSWITEEISSPNYEKAVNFIRSLLESNISLIKRIPIERLIKLLNDSDWRVKSLILKLFSRLIEDNKEVIELLDIKSLLKEPDHNIQAETLNILSKSSYIISFDLLLKKLNHSNDKVRANAIKNIKNLQEIEKKKDLISKIPIFIEDPSNLIRTAALELLASVDDFKQYTIPMEPILNALNSTDDKLRDAAISALQRYNEENPKAIEVESILKRIDKTNTHILIDILNLIGDFWNKKIRFWNKNPEKILDVLLKFIKFDNNEVREEISNIILKKYPLNQDIIFDRLIHIPDISTFVTKGIISRTLIKIVEKYPEDIIPRLNKFEDFEDDEAKINALSALEGCIENHPELVNIESLMSTLQKTNNENIKNEASKVLIKIAKRNPKAIKPVIPKIMNLFEGQKTSIKITLVKALIEIAEETPEAININLIENLLDEDDAIIRETATKILGYLGSVSEIDRVIFDILFKNALKDEDWIVREAAITSLNRLVPEIENKTFIIEKLVSMLNKEESWVQSSILNLLSEIKEIPTSQISLTKIQKLISKGDHKVKQSIAKFLGNYSIENPDDIFDTALILLDDPSKDVQDKMINSLISIIHENGLKNLLPRLLEHLSDEYSIRVNRSIARILGRTVKYAEKEIKKRVISVLEIRCEMSQDPEICRVLHDLEENI